MSTIRESRWNIRPRAGARDSKLIQLRDDCLSAFDASHNYYTHTKSAWRLVQQMVRQGHKVTIRNQATGNAVNETELSGLAQDYVTGYLVSATFQHFVSLFEQFVFDFLRAWLTEYPGSQTLLPNSIANPR